MSTIAAMQRLANVPEWLDGPLEDRPGLCANLRDLRRINRLLGGSTLSGRAIDALVPPAAPIEILDVGTGGADIPVALLARARRAGRSMRVTAIDNRPEVLQAARSVNPLLDRIPGLTLALGDGLALPYPDRAFDVGHSSLVLHHLEPDAAVGFLRELARVSRLGIVVNDLARGWTHWLGALLLTRTIARSRFTRHDGPLSVRRAYTLDELRDLLRAADLAPIHTVRGFAKHRHAVAAR